MKCRKKKLILLKTICVWCTLSISVSSCVKPRPNHITNICSIFQEYPSWYWEAQQVKKRWGLPIPVLMSIVYQESHFNGRAKPPQKKLLWIIPWLRPTSAYGYSQALNGTWKQYKRETGRTFASRNAFGAAADFIGWYAERAHKRAGVSKYSAYQMYLAYHEGIGGYAKKTYQKKAWLIKVARKVEKRKRIYQAQLTYCRTRLPQKPFWHVW
jgi:hypothetical protein